MGITIYGKTKSIDLGGFGFNRLRSKVAELAGDEIKQHYDDLNRGLWLPSNQKELFFKVYDEKTGELVEKYKDKKMIFNFLYAPDEDAVFSPDVCKCIWEVIKDYDDDLLYGYAGREDCATFADFKEIVKECMDNDCEMEWH